MGDQVKDFGDMPQHIWVAHLSKSQHQKYNVDRYWKKFWSTYWLILEFKENKSLIYDIFQTKKYKVTVAIVSVFLETVAKQI